VGKPVRRRRRRSAKRSTRRDKGNRRPDAAVTTGALFLGALLDEVARYCRATSQELKDIGDGGLSPRQALLRLARFGQHYLSSLATLPTRVAAEIARPLDDRGRRPRRQGRIIE